MAQYSNMAMGGLFDSGELTLNPNDFGYYGHGGLNGAGLYVVLGIVIVILASNLTLIGYWVCIVLYCNHSILKAI